MDRLQPVAYEFEGLAESFFERVVQFLVDSLAHLIELPLIALLQFPNSEI